MLYFANWKIALICVVCALGVLLSLPNLFSPSFLAQMPKWLPHKQVALGLDLRGGSYLLLEVDVAAAQRDRLNLIIDNVRNALRDANIGYTGLNVEGDATGTKEPTIQREGADRILVQLPGVDNPEHVKALLGRTAKLTFQLVDTTVSLEDARRGRLPPADVILPAEEGRGGHVGPPAYVVRKRVMV